MKYLLYRLFALTLAVLVLLSAMPQLAAVPAAGGDPRITLGTFSGDMLAGGGTQVRTELGQFYLGQEDGYIYNHTLRGGVPVYAHRAARLNYADGRLYFARLEDDSFDLCSLDVASGTERVLLEGLRGKLGQVYLTEGSRLDFLCDQEIWELNLDSGEYRMLLMKDGLQSFVPTGSGLIYAVGTLFDYTLFADRNPVAEHVCSYYADFDLDDGVLIYNQGGVDYQIPLAAAFAGQDAAELFAGEQRNALSDGIKTLSALVRSGGDPNVQPDEASAAEEMDERNRDILNEDGNRPPELNEPVDNSLPELEQPDPAEYDEDPQAPAEPVPTEPVQTEPEPTEPELTEPAPTEPVQTEPEPTEPKPTEPAPTEPVQTEPEATEPVQTEPAPVEPKPTAPVPAEPVTPVPAEPQPADPMPADPVPEDPTPEDAPAPAEPTAPAPWTVPESASIGQPPIYPERPEEDDGAIRMQQSEGVENIVRRARQMLEIRWTPRKNIVGWRGRYIYQAGVTYTGLPYGQPVDASYVPWDTSLPEFISRINYIESLAYTSYSNFNGARAPYYSVDCSGFVSWAWGLPSRATTWSLPNYATLVSSSTYTGIQVGDILDNISSHVLLVTDVTYDADGVINGIQVSESTPTTAYYGCCRSTWFRGSTDLAAFNYNYLGQGYSVYRLKNRDDVTYEHECVVPLEDDACPICGTGMFLRRGVDVSQWQSVIDWQTAAPYLNFAIIRLGYGGKLDTQYRNNVKGCADNQIPYGLYHYGLAVTPEEARREAEFVLANLDGASPELPIFYDVEEADGNLALPNAELLRVVAAFCETIENAGYRAGVYCSTFFWNTKLPDPEYNRWCRWVAHAASVCTCNRGANLWQCTDNGYVPGIPTNVDIDFWFGPVGNEDHRFRTAELEPTCVSAGGVGFVCVDCGYAVLKNTNAPGHQFVDGVCRVCGETESTTTRFRDIKSNDWYADAVEYVVEQGLFNGVSKDRFAPNLTMNRAMLVTVMWRLDGSQKMEAEKLFSDVPGNAYYSSAVTWAAHAGIANGTGGNVFSPNVGVTREQIVTFLYRYASMLGMDRSARAELDIFPDVGALSKYSKDAMSWAVALGLITGSKTVDGVYLLPKSVATRAQVAAILQRFARYLEQLDRGGEDPEEEPTQSVSPLPRSLGSLLTSQGKRITFRDSLRERQPFAAAEQNETEPDAKPEEEEPEAENESPDPVS